MRSRPDPPGPRSASPAGAPGRRRAAASTGRRLRRPTASEVLLLWAPTALGVSVALIIIAAVAVTRSSGAGPAPRASIDYAWTPPVADYTPGVATRAPSPTPTASPLPRLSPTPKRTTAKPRTTPPAPPPPPPVTGRYTVVDAWQGGFIGEVLVTNPSGDPRDWTVRVQFPRGVGRLNTFWVDGVPQPALSRLGEAYIFTGSVPVAARGRLALRMHFDQWGRDRDPTACAVNGKTCD